MLCQIRQGDQICHMSLTPGKSRDLRLSPLTNDEHSGVSGVGERSI